MKNVLKQLGKAICYFLLFLVSQNLVAMVYMFLYGMKAGVESAMTGQPIDELALAEGMVAYINESTTAIICISGCLTMLVLWLFFLIRKKNLLTEANIKTFPVKNLPILIVLGFALQIFLSFAMSLLPAEMLEDYMESLTQTVGTFGVVSVLAQVIAAPVVEEIIFRGLMLSRLRKAMPTVVAVIISSAAFGLVHGQILWMTYAFLLGVFFSIIAIKTDSLFVTIILHAVFNGASVVLSLITIEIPMAAYIILVIVGGVLSCGATYLLLKNKAKSPKVEMEQAV